LALASVKSSFDSDPRLRAQEEHEPLLFAPFHMKGQLTRNDFNQFLKPVKLLGETTYLHQSHLLAPRRMPEPIAP
jgi:hypothetical protein